MKEIKVGEILSGNEVRDAIHVALYPVRANMDLDPGAHVALVPGTTNSVEEFDSEDTIGIIDPFLTRKVKEGEWCWLFLYPQTVTSLRHHWTHPGIPDTSPPDTSSTDESREYIQYIADKCGLSYRALFDLALDYYNESAFSYNMGYNEDYKEVTTEEWRMFWKHFAKITGFKTEDKDGHFFTCSC